MLAIRGRAAVNCCVCSGRCALASPTPKPLATISVAMFSKLLAHFRRLPSSLTEQQAARLKSLQRKISTHRTAVLTKDRIVVVDVESTGLSLANDHLIAIGAVAIR